MASAVRQLAAQLDASALEAIANRGTVRRARKDFERSPPKLIEETEQVIVLAIGDARVELRAPAGDSRCDCIAAQTCRHIVSGWLWLMETTQPDPSDSATLEQCLAELLAVDDADLVAWGGIALVRQASRELALGLRVEPSSDLPLEIRLPDWNQTCRWIPAGGPHGMLCTCRSQQPCEHRMAAIVGLRVARGVKKLDVVDATPEASQQAPRSRAQVVAAVSEYLCQLVAEGLCSASVTSPRRLRGLATSAHGVDLPRLSLALEACAEELRRWQHRDGQSDSAAVLGRLSHAEILCAALERGSPGAVGRHRAAYRRVGNLDLAGVGARLWQTPSGYRGLTLFFWDPENRQWGTWSDARPTDNANFDPRRRFDGPGPWDGCTSPRRAAASRIRLAGGWRSDTGRLSGRPGVRATLLGPTRLDGLPVLDTWDQARDHAHQLFGSLTNQGSQQRYVLLRPALWTQPSFDAARQRLVWWLEDGNGARLRVVLPYSDVRAAAIEAAEHLAVDGSRFDAVFCQLRLDGEGLWVEPVSYLQEGEVVSLDFATPTAHSISDSASPSALADADVADDDERPDESDQDDAILLGVSGVLGDVVQRAGTELAWLAESGTSARAHRTQLRALANELARMELTVLAEPLMALASEAEPRAAAKRCLRTTYYVGLANVCVALEYAAQDRQPDPAYSGT